MADGSQHEAKQREVEGDQNSVGFAELVHQVTIDHSSSRSDHDDDDENDEHYHERVDERFDMLVIHIDTCPPRGVE